MSLLLSDESSTVAGRRVDPVREDEDLRMSFEPKLAMIGRRLHEGGSVVDVLTILNEFRIETQDRGGWKWFRRDRRVAEVVLRWYQHETGEAPDRFRTN